MAITKATSDDIPQLEKLLNSAYRGEDSKKGWTTEADLLEGNIRTDPDTLYKIMHEPGASLLKYTNEKSEVGGCVFLQKHAHRLYLGMLSVLPWLQAKGIGKLLMTAAETYAKDNNCSVIFMKVISVRNELISWYERKGYRKTGETEPFPHDGKFGTPTQPLEFLIMEKKLD